MSAPDTLAYVHTGCGHAAAVGALDNEPELREWAERYQLGPEWEIRELAREDAIARYRAGGSMLIQPCGQCRIEGDVIVAVKR